jgi:hypothetical protein
MPLPDTKQIDISVSKALGVVDVKQLDVKVLLQIGSLLEVVDKIKDDPRSIGKEFHNLLVALGKTSFSVDAKAAADVKVSLEDIVAIAAQIKEAIDSGALQSIEVPPIVSKLTKKITDAIPQRLIGFLQKLADSAPANALADMAAKAGEIAQAVADFLPFHVRLQDLAVEMVDVKAALNVTPPATPDFALIAPKLVHVNGGLEVLVDDLTPLLNAAAARLDAIDTTAFTTGLTKAFDSLTAIIPEEPVRLSDLFDPLRDAAAELHLLAEGKFHEQVDEIVAQLHESLAEEGIGDSVKDMLVEVLDRLQKLQLPALRAAVEKTLAGAAKSVHDAAITGPDELKKAVDDFVNAVFDSAELAKGVKTIRDTVKTFVDGITPALEKIKEAIAVAPGLAKDYVDKAVAILEKVKAKLDEITNEIKSIDFAAAAAESHRLMEEGRANLEEVIRSADLPPEARSAISLAAQGLKQINFDEDVARPIQEELDKLDPKKIVESLEAEVAKVRKVLENIVPEAIIAQLDPPFDKAVAMVNKYTPAALEVLAKEELAKLDLLLEHANPAPLLLALKPEYDQVVQFAEAQANFHPLFQPIEEAYQDAREAINGLNLQALFVGLVKDVAKSRKSLEDGIRDSTNEMAGAVLLLAEYHLGDVVRPLVDVVQELRVVVDSLSDDQINALVAILAAPAAALQNIGDPRLFFGLGAAVDVEVLLHELNDLAIQVQADLGETDLEVDLLVHFEAMGADSTELEAAMRRLADRLTPPALVASANRLGAAIERAVPQELLEIPAGTPPRDAIHLILDRLDPTPLAEELDALGVQMDADLAVCIHEMGEGEIQVIAEFFGIADVAGALVELELEKIVAEANRQLDALDPAGVEGEVQAIADGIVDVIRAFSPETVGKSLDDSFQKARLRVIDLGTEFIDAVTKPAQAPLPDFEKLRPSVYLEKLVGSMKELKEALNKILAFDFGKPLVKAVEHARPVVDDVLEDVHHQFDELIEFLEKQKVA